MTKKTMETKFILFCLALCLVWANAALAINVPDGTFDEHDVGDGLWSYVNNVPGHDWISENTGGGTPWIGNNYGNGYPTMGHTGAQFIDMNSAIIRQTLSGNIYEEGVEYELSMHVTTTYEGQTLDIHFLDGDDWENPLASRSFDVAIEADLATWSKYSFKYTATAEDHGKPIGIAFWGGYNTWSDTVALDTAIDPVTPLDGSVNVLLEETLEWTSPTEFEATGYDVYFGTDPNKLNNPLVVDYVDTSTFDPFGAGDMAYGTTYYWWVDVYEPNYVPDYIPIRHAGPMWSFTTEAEEPTIIADPVGVLVDAGGEAVFSVEHINGTSYEWHKAGGGVVDSGSTTSGQTITLSLASVSQSDEGYYYCKVINASAPEGVDSAEAKLMTRRLVGHWSMDGTGAERNVADSSLGDVDGTVVSRNVTDVGTEVADPGAGWTWVTGINGSALNLAQNAANTDVHDYVILATSGDPTDLEFGATTDFSVSVWIKGTDFSVGEGTYDAAIISNKDWNSGGNAGWVMDINTGTNQLEWNIGGGGRADYDPTGGALLNDDEWHHLVATHDRDGNATFYVDGVLQDTRNIAYIGNINSGYPTVIGTDGAQGTVWGAWFRGTIDDVRMWNYVINPYAVAALYTDFVPTADPWCVENASIPDYNNSCTVDLADFAAIASKWAECNAVPECLDQHDYSVD